MTCNYFEYRDMTEKMFYGVALTDSHLNRVTEQIRQYLVNGGAGNIVKALNIGIKVVTKKTYGNFGMFSQKKILWLKRNKIRILKGDKNGKNLYNKR